MNKEKYEQGYIQAKKDYDLLINKGYTKQNAIYELSYLCPYYPQFEDTKRHKYIVIKTSYGKGYEQCLNDIEKEWEEHDKRYEQYE